MTPQDKENELDDLVRAIDKGLTQMLRGQKDVAAKAGARQIILVAVRAAYIMGRQHCMQDFMDGSLGPPSSPRNGERHSGDK